MSALRRKLDSSGVQTLESKRACEGWEESVVYSGEGGAAETIYRISSLCENEAACLHIQVPPSVGRDIWQNWNGARIPTNKVPPFGPFRDLAIKVGVGSCTWGRSLKEESVMA